MIKAERLALNAALDALEEMRRKYVVDKSCWDIWGDAFPFGVNANRNWDKYTEYMYTIEKMLSEQV